MLSPQSFYYFVSTYCLFKLEWGACLENIKTSWISSEICENPDTCYMKHHQSIHMAVYKPAETKTPEQLHVNSQQEILKKAQNRAGKMTYGDKLVKYNLISGIQKFILQWAECTMIVTCVYPLNNRLHSETCSLFTPTACTPTCLGV